jgi:hypothetical protein
MLDENYKSRIPQLTLEGIKNYVDNKIPTGSFLRAVLENNLLEAFKRADEGNISAMQEIVAYCYWEIPGNCWGSAEKVQEWLDSVDEPDMDSLLEQKYDDKYHSLKDEGKL